MRQSATRVFAAQQVRAGFVIGKDGVYLRALPRNGSTNGKVESQDVPIKTRRRDMDVHWRHLILLANCSKETGAVTASNLLLAIDHHLRGVHAVEMESLAVAFWRSV